MVLDVFSKYGWTVPLKDKKVRQLLLHLNPSSMKANNHRQYLWTDKGKEYYDKHAKSVGERWNRTIKQKMWKQFTIQGNTHYLEMLPKILEK